MAVVRKFYLTFHLMTITNRSIMRTKFGTVVDQKTRSSIVHGCVYIQSEGKFVHSLSTV
jgi:hypothetical protein